MTMAIHPAVGMILMEKKLGCRQKPHIMWSPTSSYNTTREAIKIL